MKQIDFYKLHGLGNSFVISEFHKDLNPALICDGNYGVGADGLIFVLPSVNGTIPIKMFNKDGSPMKMCGNGMRCVVRYVFLTNSDLDPSSTLTFNVYSRKIVAKTNNRGKSSCLNIGVPSFNPADLPCTATGWPSPISVSDKVFDIFPVFVGNPHGVIILPHIDEFDVKKYGPLIETHETFPERANIDFVEICDKKTLKLRVWERGVGETYACGTGSCASVAALNRAGMVDRDCTVKLRGGELKVSWDKISEEIFLEGPAQEVFKGSFFVNND